MKTDKQNYQLLDALWGLFASVKLTVVILILLATTSLVGTLIPQNADPAYYMRAYGEFAYRVLHVLDIFDMYYSWWFQTLIGILTINITVCTFKRWPVIWKIASSKGAIKSLYQTTGVQESFIIDKDGMIAEKVIGPRGWATPGAILSFRNLVQRN